jgi:hypothetical protein
MVSNEPIIIATADILGMNGVARKSGGAFMMVGTKDCRTSFARVLGMLFSSANSDIPG